MKLISSINSPRRISTRRSATGMFQQLPVKESKAFHYAFDAGNVLIHQFSICCRQLWHTQAHIMEDDTLLNFDTFSCDQLLLCSLRNDAEMIVITNGLGANLVTGDHYFANTTFKAELRILFKAGHYRLLAITLAKEDAVFSLNNPSNPEKTAFINQYLTFLGIDEINTPIF